MVNLLQKSASLFKILNKTSQLCNTKQINKFQVAFLVSKANRDFQYPSAYPYEEKGYNLLDAIFDGTTWRFNENSKIIVVEGSVTCEKDKISKAIADHFDLLHIPHATLDPIYRNEYGYDLRLENDKLPQILRSFEERQFMENPFDERAALMQRNYFRIRGWQYYKALNHVFNTGQGVVLTRCVYSDFVFLDTYMKFGFLPSTMREYYNMNWRRVREYFMRPHAVVYLDCPVDTIVANLKKRNDPVAINSPINKPEVLAELENNYKKKYLKDMSSHAEILLYDCSSPVDQEVIFEDLEMVNLEFDLKNKNESKMNDWHFPKEKYWNQKRMELSKRYAFMLDLQEVPNFDCPELWIEVEDQAKYSQVLNATPGGKYAYGYNKEKGDSFLFKNKVVYSPNKPILELTPL